MSSRLTVAACLVLALSVSCRSSTPDEPAVAEPSVKFSRERIALGSPVNITYRFEVASGARFDRDYIVMGHFLDGDDELMWTDDHLPPTPTSQWKAGQVIEYTRTVFIPVYQYIGPATFNVGLYSPQDQRRLPLSGEEAGRHSYKAATLELLPQTENIFLRYKSGWHEKEVASEGSLISWQWTKKNAIVSFRNPKRESRLYIHLDNPGKAFTDPQRVDVLTNGQRVDSFELPPEKDVIHTTPLTAPQLGTGDMAEIELQVDKTHVPALLPASNSRDSRELGVRVFHLFVEPRSR